jgi:hypothetical protein
VLAYIGFFGKALYSANSAPEFDIVSDQTIFEGDQLNLPIIATDFDGDQLTISLISRPSGTIFVDNGNGTADLSWQSAFTGPNSSERSPILFGLRVSDGQATDQLDIFVNVMNNNRFPEIDPIADVEIEAGEPVSVSLSGFDPDNDATIWKLLNSTAPISFNPDGNPQITWQTVYADSGIYDISVALEDIHGAADTSDITLTVSPKSIYALSIDEISGYPGELVDVNVNLMNLEEISSANLLVNYDPSALLLAQVTFAGSRIEAFEYLTYSLNHNNQDGDIQILAVANLNPGGPYDNLVAGDGPLVKLRFYITNDYSFAGFNVPIRFVFRDILYYRDNTFEDPDGYVIPQEAIGYDDGWVLIIKADPSSIGDINLNGVNFEIADVIYLINYFIDPVSTPMDPEQRANSDVNQDGLSATIADLVHMINVITNRYAGKLRYGGDPVAIGTKTSDGNFSVRYNSETELGGLAIVLESNTDIAPNAVITSELEKYGMKIKSAVKANKIRLLIYSDDGRALPAGLAEFISISGHQDLKINEVQFSSIDGTLLKTTFDNGMSLLPEGYRLYQNYPNPFNPMTDIRFDLPIASKTELKIFDILGREIRELVNFRLPAGNHKYIWDGTDNNGANVSSGIYLYRLKAGDFISSRKMILLK